MAGTKAGGIKVAATNKAKYGDDYYVNIGKIGGRTKNPLKGFGTNRGLAKVAGAVGGRRSRRPRKVTA